jgi:hypothetical protein
MLVVAATTHANAEAIIDRASIRAGFPTIQAVEALVLDRSSYHVMSDLELSGLSNLFYPPLRFAVLQPSLACSALQTRIRSTTHPTVRVIHRHSIAICLSCGAGLLPSTPTMSRAIVGRGHDSGLPPE